MAGSAGWPQPSWTGRGEVWIGVEPGVRDVVRTALAVAAVNLPVLAVLRLLANPWLRIPPLLGFAGLLATAAWLRWRPVLGIVLVVEALVFLAVTSSAA
jgi:hypothetical protein